MGTLNKDTQMEATCEDSQITAVKMKTCQAALGHSAVQCLENCVLSGGVASEIVASSFTFRDIPRKGKNEKHQRNEDNISPRAFIGEFREKIEMIYLHLCRIIDDA